MGYKFENLEKWTKLEKTGDWQKALSFGREWAAAEPHNFLAWQGIGDALTELGRVDESIPIYRKALEVAPAHPVEFFDGNLSTAPLWYRLGNAYTKLGDSTRAIESLKKAANIDPGAAEIWNNLGIAYVNANNAQEAVKAFKSGLAANSSDTTVLTNLGLLYARCNVAEGVTSVHRMLSKLDSRAASTFLAGAKQILSGR